MMHSVYYKWDSEMQSEASFNKKVAYIRRGTNQTHASMTAVYLPFFVFKRVLTRQD